MDGQKFMATRFAATLRRRLFRQHLGLIRPQDIPGPIENASRAVGIENEYDFGSPEDITVTVWPIH
jgi:phospholipase D1/2